MTKGYEGMGISADAWMQNYVSLTENGWASFEDAVTLISDHLDVAMAAAQRMLREACASGDVRSQQLICDERFGWVPEAIKPKEWLEDQMDLKWQQREDVIGVLHHGMEDDGDRPENKDLNWTYIDVDTLPDNIQELFKKVDDARRRLWEARKKLIQHVGVYVNKSDCEHWLDKLKPEAQSTAGGKQSRIICLLADMFPAGVPSRADCPRQTLTAELVKRDPSLKPLDLKTLKTAIETYNRQPGNAGKR